MRRNKMKDFDKKKVKAYEEEYKDTMTL